MLISSSLGSGSGSGGSGKGMVTNFDQSFYEKEIPWLMNITQDELIEVLRSEGRKQAAQRLMRSKFRCDVAAPTTLTAIAPAASLVNPTTTVYNTSNPSNAGNAMTMPVPHMSGSSGMDVNGGLPCADRIK
uniref:Uncharacterized protein n=1 Tax=Polytomella parva TaxID=51329 RepID=A0A7S0UYR5_9CHLO